MHRFRDRAVLFLPPETVEPEALEQIANTASMPFVHQHVAVMPDCVQHVLKQFLNVKGD